MERFLVFITQFFITVIATFLWMESAGDGPSAPLWLIVDTVPVLLATFVVFLLTLWLRRRTNRIVMSSCIIGVYFLMRYTWIVQSEGDLVFITYFLLNPILPELFCLLYYVKEEKKCKESLN